MDVMNPISITKVGSGSIPGDESFRTGPGGESFGSGSSKKVPILPNPEPQLWVVL